MYAISAKCALTKIKPTACRDTYIQMTICDSTGSNFAESNLNNYISVI